MAGYREGGLPIGAALFYRGELVPGSQTAARAGRATRSCTRR